MGWLFARLYDRMTRRSEAAGVAQWRRELLAGARGEVLEIGSGTGANLPCYAADCGHLILSEPNRHMRARLQHRLRELGRRDADVLDAAAGDLPLADGSVDCVISTLVLCTVPDPERAIREIRRVLKPDGTLLYLEHVAGEDPRVQRWQRRIEPLWKWLAQGCHLTRETGALLEQGGFELTRRTAAAMPAAPFFVRPTIRGVARPR